MAVREQPRHLAPLAGGDVRQILAAVITVLALIGVAAEVVYLLRATEVSDLSWSRTVSAVTPLQTIAFAAVGWVFGKEVHRQEAEHARTRADHAEARAEDAEQSLVSAKTEAASDRANANTVANLVLLKQRKVRNAAAAAATAAAAVTDERPESTAVRASRGGATDPVAKAAQPLAADADLDELAELVRSLYPDLN